MWSETTGTMMSPAILVPLVLKVSVILMVFALGLRVRARDTAFLLQRRSLFFRSMLAMNVLLPVFVVTLVASFNFYPAVKIALLFLSISPVPPLFPTKGLKAAGRSSYIFSLLVIEAVLAILIVPLGVEIFGIAFGRPAQVPPITVALVVLSTVLAPLGAGMVIRHAAVNFAERIAKPVALVAVVLLAASLIPILSISATAIVSLIGNGTLAAIVAFILVGLTVGHLLGGPEPTNRTVLALSTASRHPGVALAVATTNFSGERLVLAALFLYLIVNAVVSFPYLVWRRRRS